MPGRGGEKGGARGGTPEGGAEGGSLRSLVELPVFGGIPRGTVGLDLWRWLCGAVVCGAAVLWCVVAVRWACVLLTVVRE